MWVVQKLEFLRAAAGFDFLAIFTAFMRTINLVAQNNVTPMSNNNIPRQSSGGSNNNAWNLMMNNNQQAANNGLNPSLSMTSSQQRT